MKKFILLIKTFFYLTISLFGIVVTGPAIQAFVSRPGFWEFAIIVIFYYAILSSLEKTFSTASKFAEEDMKEFLK